MALISKWANVQVSMQSALAAAVTLSGVTKANPGVASWATGTDPVNGDYGVFSALGMRQINARVIRFANVNGAGNTAELEGIDSTGFDTFASGSFQVVTFGVTFSTIVGWNAEGGDFDFLDTTTIHDTNRSQIPNLPNALKFSYESIWDVSDAALLAMKVASDTQARRAFRLTFANGQKYLFMGYCGASLAPGGSAGDLVKTPGVITSEGLSTVYAT